MHATARDPILGLSALCPLYVQNETARMNRGVVSRNRGLEYIDEGRLEGIVYVMDDDNTYSWQVRMLSSCGLGGADFPQTSASASPLSD